MFNKKLGLIFLIVAFLALVGCASGSSGENSSSDGDKELSLWAREASADLMGDAVEAFNSKDNGIKINVKSIPADNFSDQLATAYASESAPDIVAIDLILAPYYSSIGAFKDLSERYESLSFKDELNQSMLNLGEREGKQYALPYSSDVSALIYNKDHFEDAGLDPDSPPETWQELRDYANQLTTDDRFGYVYSGGSAGGLMFTFMPYVWGNGGAVLSDDGTAAEINSPEAIEALQFFTDLTQTDKVTPEGVTTYVNEAEDAFTSGKVSMIVSGNYVVGKLNEDYPDLDYGVALIPRNEGKEHSSFSGGELIAISKSTEYVDEAWEFIEYALTEDVQVEAFASNGIIPVRNDFVENKYFKEEPKYQVFAEAANYANAPYTTKYNELYNPILSGLQKAFSGELSPEDAVVEISDGINDVLNK
ncbi:ABC transporter substrate-binding protein [Aquibacillus albus]|uniref:Multiple sugar transport system substrate-binding protein n=1 Tax=Aquibacillus albus TaxID=1168171 RepID=A0ABS2N3J9_9BACI|nr:sugar ABC transporter substrate-binding protein [Aquibacillus albus]MBM7572713.1 multiple sugar transport system substrate-binding protein [Aquibacillus albus]